jgi:hypothetical protein
MKIGARDQIRIDVGAVAGQRRHVTVVAGVVDEAVVAPQHGDAPVTQLQQMLDRGEATLPVAHPDTRRCLVDRIHLVDQDQGSAVSFRRLCCSADSRDVTMMIPPGRGVSIR